MAFFSTSSLYYCICNTGWVLVNTFTALFYVFITIFIQQQMLCHVTMLDTHLSHIRFWNTKVKGWVFTPVWVHKVIAEMYYCYFLSKHIYTLNLIRRHLGKNGCIWSRLFSNTRFLQCRHNSVPKLSGSFTKYFLNDQKAEKHDPWETIERNWLV